MNMPRFFINRPIFAIVLSALMLIAGAIALFQVDGIDNVKLGAWLFNQHRIVNTPIVHPEFKGIRITPNVYTTLEEIDTFTEAMREVIKRGSIPA